MRDRRLATPTLGIRVGDDKRGEDSGDVSSITKVDLCGCCRSLRNPSYWRKYYACGFEFDRSVRVKLRDIPRFHSSVDLLIPHQMTVEQSCVLSSRWSRAKGWVWCCGSTTAVFSSPPMNRLIGLINRLFNRLFNKKRKKSSEPSQQSTLPGIPTSVATGSRGFQAGSGIVPQSG